VVVYDYLAAPELLELAPTGARKIYAGKVGAKHTFKQEEINRLLVEEGRAGRVVVRLKGGDPYVFGRGAEEALELFEAGVPFEVVPGVSSVIGAAGAAGIPLTHRDMGSQIGILTGHEKAGKAYSGLDFEALGKLGTLAVVMGVENLANILERLIAAGKDGATPAALIEWGATARQKVAVGTLGGLFGEVQRLGLSSPALLIVGEVVGLRDKLNWYEKRPLFGKRVLVTRTRKQAGRLAAAFRELGAEVVERPAIEIRPITPNSLLDEALNNLAKYRYLVFTSPNGVNVFMRALFEAKFDSRALHAVTIAVIGPGTAEALNAFGLTWDLMPKRFIAEGVVKLFEDLPVGPVLLPRALEARDALVLGLSNLGFDLDLVPIYETLIADWSGFENLSFIGYNKQSSGELKPSNSHRPIDLATLTSASTAKGLSNFIGPDERGQVPVVSIGPITTKAANELGFKVVAEAKKATVEALVEAATEYLII
jgi:uroporphyrinogen III methyltransferase/synthase